MLNAREQVEHEILWEIKSGTINIWHENWTGLGALYHVLPPDFSIEEKLQEVAEPRQGREWNGTLIDQNFPKDVVEHIKKIHYDSRRERWDKPYWMPTSSGKFTINSSWQILRHRRHKLSTDDLRRKQGYICVSRCWYCQHPQEETYEDIFLTSNTTTKVWKQFMAAAGITEPELWKRRNTGKYGGTISTNRVIHEVNKTLHYLAKIRYPWLTNILALWANVIQFFGAYKPILITKRVNWPPLYAGWYKCNTNRASKGNPGPSSIGFCVRDEARDLVYAKSIDTGVTTNVVVEAQAILQGLEYCVTHEKHPLILESGSLTLKKDIEGEWDSPWCISAEVQKIKEIKNYFNVILQYIFREGNTLADFIANIVFSGAATNQFLSFSKLPSTGKRIVNLDKLQIPNLRVRIAKRRDSD
ncbi:uncharacterized protein LOC142173504 [Nicotiana tabacum]|uniref:Uncharacterized protein LOC142173504 n=1 Tax=Nicotiana tabacum TaxID=4097 RepID=A0AC58TDB7_TOBAC